MKEIIELNVSEVFDNNHQVMGYRATVHHLMSHLRQPLMAMERSDPMFDCPEKCQDHIIDIVDTWLKKQGGESVYALLALD